MVTMTSEECDFKEELRSKSWSNLDPDILNEIIRRLDIVDQIYFRATCKSWRLEQYDRYANRLPWLMTHDWDGDSNGNILSICKYYVPSLNQTFMNKHKMIAERWKDIFGASVCASKYGWLLLQSSSKAFLYNPFIKEIIELPDMVLSFNRSTFSSIPTSQDCVIFAVESSKSSNIIRISTCHRGDLEWKTHSFDGFFRVIEDVVYSSGAFYCVFSGGVLGEFSIARQDWKLLTDMEPITGITHRDRVRMVESDGQLLLVCFSVRLHIFRFDWSQMTWVQQNGLGNRALFLGCTSFSISAVEEASDLVDTIYNHGDITRFYSLKTHKYYQCSEFYPWPIHRDSERIWIDPPQL